MNEATTTVPTKKRIGRPPGAGQQAATRERVLDTAEKLFLEKGFRATSLHEIAVAADRTTGAIYWSFSGKDDLFLEVFRRRIGRQEAVWREALAPVANSMDATAAIGTALRLAMPDPAWQAVQFEFFSFAARDERLSHELALVYRRPTRVLAELLSAAGVSSVLPVDRLASVLLSLARGLALTWFVDPEATDQSLFPDATAVLLGVSTDSTTF